MPGPEQTEQTVEVKEATPDLAAQYDLGDESTPVTPSPDAGVAAPAPETAPASPPLNAAGLPYDPATGRLLPRTPREQQPEPEPEPTPEPPRKTHMQLVAEDLGIDHEGMSEDALVGAVRAVQRSLKQLREAESFRSDMHGATDRRNREPEPAAVPEQSDDIDFGITPAEEETIHPDVLALIKRTLGASHKKIQALEREVKGLRAGFDQQVSETNTGRIDKALLAIGDARLGKGRRAELQDGSAEVKRRKAVVAQAVELAGPKASIHQVCAKIKEAHALLYGEPVAAPAPKAAQQPGAPKPAYTEEQWQNASLRRPTHRVGSQEPNGVVKAVQAIADLQREAGGASSEPDSVDDFPG